MSRYIDADALIKAMCSNCALFLDKTCDGNRISCYPSSIVREQPTVDAVPAGWWVTLKNSVTETAEINRGVEENRQCYDYACFVLSLMNVIERRTE